MDFDHKKVRRRMIEDRLSGLPDELIHQILSSFDMKFVVQTCLLSSRWKLLWTSMTCLNFSNVQFDLLSKFAEFVTHVLSHCNHQLEVSLVKLNFHGADQNEVFVEKIANYAFSHNVQELTIVSWPGNHIVNYPPCLFRSPSLRHLTLGNFGTPAFIGLEIPLDLPALTTLHLYGIVLLGDLFSKFVNLKNLTLQRFFVDEVGEVFDIIAPRLSNLKLAHASCWKFMNIIAPQLENLNINSCFINHLNAPPGLSSLCYRGYLPPQLSNDRFHSLNEVTIRLYLLSFPYKEEDALKIINMLQKFHSARYVTLNAGIVECISSFSDLLSHHPSPFSDLICLTIDASTYIHPYKVKMSTEARNFLLENSPSASLIMKYPRDAKVMPT